jgi:hypothetical protein
MFECDRVVSFCRIRDCNEKLAVHNSKSYCKTKKENYRNEEAIDILEYTHFTENERKENEQVACEGNDYPFFFDIRDVIVIERVPEGQTVNPESCFKVLTKF